MKQVKVRDSETINLGYQYESNVTEVIFDMSKVYSEVGIGGEWNIIYLYNDKRVVINPSHIVIGDDVVAGVITEEVTSHAGDGNVQLTYVLDGAIKKTLVYYTNVMDSIEPPICRPIIYKGTTPSLTFNVDFDTHLIGSEGEVKVLFAQDRRVVLKKSAEINVEDNTIICRLTHDDTLTFIESIPLYIELGVKLASEIEITSKLPIIVDVKHTLISEV